jgi:predicted nuclease of predicted toxin-antitoxin system
MLILANENLPRLAVESLRERGHDVLWARTDMAGTSDEEILRIAADENRLIVTLDKDFGALAFQRGLPASCGIVLLRLAAPGPDALAKRIVTALLSRADWCGWYATVEDTRTRFRPLPPQR